MRLLLNQDGGDGSGGASGDILDGQGQFDARSMLPEDLRNEGTFTNLLQAKSREEFMGNLAKGYHSAQKMIGERNGAPGVQLPEEGASDEQWSEFFQKTGRPETDAGYELSDDDTKLRQAVIPNDEDYLAFRKFVFDSGVSKKRGESLIKNVFGLLQKAGDRADVKFDVDKAAAMDDLNGTWGLKTDENINIANHAMATLFKEDPTTWARIKSSGLNNDPLFIKHLYNYGAQAFEREIANGAGRTPEGFSGRAAAEAEIQALNKSKDFQADLWGKNGLEAKKQAQARMEMLFKRKNGK